MAAIIFLSSPFCLVRDSSAIRQLFFRLAGAVGCQRTLHKENSGFASTTLGRHNSTFRGYRISFSIRNPYINRFTNHFSIHSWPSYPQKVVLHSITARFCLRSYYSAIWLPWTLNFAFHNLIRPVTSFFKIRGGSQPNLFKL